MIEIQTADIILVRDMTFLADTIVGFEEVEDHKPFNPLDKHIPEHAEIGYDTGIIAQQNPPHPCKFPVEQARGIMAIYRWPDLTDLDKNDMRKFMDTTFDERTPYSFYNLVDVALNNMLPEDKNHVFCSMYVLLVYVKALGIPYLKKIGLPESWFNADGSVALVKPLDLALFFANSTWMEVYHN